jgi:ankyrin repeat protein
MNSLNIYSLGDISSYFDFDTKLISNRVNKNFRMLCNLSVISDWINKKYGIDLVRSGCYRGSWRIIKYALKYCEHKLIKGFDLACLGGHLDIVKFLIEKDLVPIIDTIPPGKATTKTYDFGNGLGNACMTNHMDIINLLLEKDSNIYIGINMACKYGHLELVRILLDKCETLTTELYSQFLHWACSGGHLNVVKFIIEKSKMIVDWNDCLLNTCYAGCGGDHIDTHGQKLLIEYCIANGASNLIGGFMNACVGAQLELVCMLLSHQETYDWNVAMKQTCDNGVLCIDSDDTRSVIVSILIDRGANNYLDCFIGACKRNYVKIAKLMIHHMADTSIINFNDVFCDACFNDCIDIIKFLMESYSDKITDWERGMNDACLRKNKRIIKFLTKEAYEHYEFDICTVYTNVRGKTKIIELYLTKGTFDKSKIHWMCQDCLYHRKPFIKSKRDVVETPPQSKCNFHHEQ